MEKLLKVKEAQICESETKAKELSLRAEEFEELFNGQLASVKGDIHKRRHHLKKNFSPSLPPPCDKTSIIDKPQILSTWFIHTTQSLSNENCRHL